MKKILALLVALSMVVTVVPFALAVSIGGDVPVDIGTEDYEPDVWLCGTRVVYDDATEPGRISLDGEELVERGFNYAFEGEQIQWNVLVFDKNGIEKISDVYATVGSVQGAGNDIEVNCNLASILQTGEDVQASCNARVGQAELEDVFVDGSNTAAYYDCILTVETPLSMYGEHWVTVEAEDLDGLLGTMDENEYWFLNPVIALTIDGDLVFEDVRPGTSAYSSTLLVGNDADDGSGVMLDMFISGTDFFDSSSSGAKCPASNTLELENFRYFATNGAYSSFADGRAGADPLAESYVAINYGIGFNDPTPFYNSHEVLQASPVGPYWTANLLSPGSEMAVTFRLDLPEPCNGDFDSGSLFFWGEAV